jgi:CheY-like chemotaxis protein
VPLVLITFILGSIVYIPIVWIFSSSKARSGFRVLLVDDSPNTLMLIKSVLSSRNCIIKTVDSGLKAIEELTREKYDLMVLDYFMPGLNGTETLNLADQAIKGRKVTDTDFQIPVIEYSSARDESISPKPLNHFTLVGKLSKSMPPSMLRPLLSQILNDVSGCTA